MHEVLDILLRLRGLPAFEGAMARARRSVSGFSRHMDRFTGRTLKAQEATRKFTRTVGIGLGVGLAALGLGIGKSVSLAAAFEQQMSRLGAVSDASAKQMRLLRKEALDLGKSTQYSALEVARAQTELAKGGLGPGQITGGATRAALALAAAGELDLADAATVTVNAMKQFNLAGRDTIRIADMLATAANTTTADVSDFGIALRQGGGAAKMAGLGLNDTIATLEALADASVKGSDAGTSMRVFLNYLASPPNKRARELTRELGLSFFDLQGNMRPVPEIAARIKTAFDGMTRKQRTANGTILVGQDGVRTLNALFEAGPDRIRRYMEANSRMGTAADVAARKQNNLRGYMERLKGALETVGIELGLRLIPFLTRAAKWAARFVEEVGTTKNIDAMVNALGTLVGILKVGIGMIIWWVREFKNGNPVVVALTGAIVGLTVGLTAYGLALKAAAAAQLLLALTNPITAVAALAGALVFAYLKVRWFRAGVDYLWGVLRRFARWIWAHWYLIPMASPFIAMYRVARLVVNWITNHWPALSRILRGPVRGVAGVFKAVFNRIRTIVSNVLRWIKARIDDVKDAINGLKDTVGTPGKVAGKALEYSPPGLLLKGGKGAVGGVKDILGFAEGGMVGSSGAAWVGEQGPELLYLPAGAQVRPILSPRSNGTLKPAKARTPVSGTPRKTDPGSGETIVLQVHLNNRVLAEAVWDETRRKEARK